MGATPQLVRIPARMVTEPLERVVVVLQQEAGCIVAVVNTAAEVMVRSMSCSSAGTED